MHEVAEPSTRAEELCVAFATALSAAMWAPRVGLVALAVLTVACVVASLYARRLFAVVDQEQESPAEAAAPTVEPSLPYRLLDRATEGDLVAGSYLRILGKLYPHNAPVAECVRRVDQLEPTRRDYRLARHLN